jgi:2-polyprenyl-6-methoxyphenol hydroxylase-like FAD-dependent oxidoreductase
MPPLGVGANLTLLDGTVLATALATAPSVDDAVRAYEAGVLPRSIETAKACAVGARLSIRTETVRGSRLGSTMVVRYPRTEQSSAEFGRHSPHGG